jgi:hypothetical protein
LQRECTQPRAERFSSTGGEEAGFLTGLGIAVHRLKPIDGLRQAAQNTGKIEHSLEIRMSGFPFGAFAFAGPVLALAVVAHAASSDPAGLATPDFAANDSAWLKTSNLWLDPPPGTPGLGPLHTDPAHPFHPRGVNKNGTDDSGTGRVGDWRDPNLRPRAVAQVKRWGAAEANGDIQVTASAACQPTGVPGIHLINEPLYIVQHKDEVVMIWQRGPRVRHIPLNVPHSRHPRPTWDGESVGHYEGDELVVDTIGFRPGAQIDHFGVTNTSRLHVIERFKIVGGGKALQVVFWVEDPGTYYHPWTGMMRYRHVTSRLTESICAENNMDYFTGNMYPLPTAAKPAF